jgi:hypothetical protein
MEGEVLQVKKVRPLIVAGTLLAAVLLAGVAAGSGSGLLFSQSGNTVTVTGYTNIAVGDRLLVEVVSAAFTPVEKGTGTGFSGAAGSVIVQPGSPLNTWRFDVNTTGFTPGLYLVTVESVETGFMDSGQFVLPWTPVPTEFPSQPPAVSPAVITPAPALPATTAAMPSPPLVPLPIDISLCAIVTAAIILHRR